MIAEVADIDFIATETEAEALLAEQEFIKRHRPRLQRPAARRQVVPVHRDLRSTRTSRASTSRARRHRRGRAYFGPFSNAKRVRETLDLLGKVFQYRTCDGPEPGRASGSPCLDYFIKRCQAPCVGYISKEEYRENVDTIIDFLSGRYRQIERGARAGDEARPPTSRSSSRRRILRNRLQGRALAARAPADRERGGRHARRDRRRRRGRRRQRPGLPGPRRRARRTARASTSRTRRSRDEGEVAEEFVLQYYASALAVPPQVIVPRTVDATPATLAEALAERRGAPVEVRHAERGDKRRILELAERNARLALDQDRLRSERRRSQRIEALDGLQRALGMDAIPMRIECFDISNLMRDPHGRVDGRVRGRRAEEVRLPPLRHPRARCRTTSRRWPRCSHGAWRSTSRSASASPHEQGVRRELRRRCRR